MNNFKAKEKEFLIRIARDPDHVTISDLHCDLASAYRSLELTASRAGRKAITLQIDRIYALIDKLEKPHRDIARAIRDAGLSKKSSNK